MKCHKCGCKNFEAKMVIVKDRPKYEDTQNGIWRCMQCHLPYVHKEPKKEDKENE